ncbi:N-acetyltransferase [bacterium]|nr:MAG: N-acetyltransferase [bacterium]
MENGVFLKGKNCYLRAFELGDEQMIRDLNNSPEPRETLYYAIPTSSIQWKERFTKELDDHSTIFFTICDVETHKPIGQTALVRIDWVGRMGIYYLGIAYPEFWGKGIGSEVTKLMVDYTFKTLNFNRIELKVASENTGAIKVYEKQGFKREGTLRQAMYRDGRYSDFHVMSIIRDDLD